VRLSESVIFGKDAFKETKITWRSHKIRGLCGSGLWQKHTEIAEMSFLRSKEAESEERKQTTEIYLRFI